MLLELRTFYGTSGAQLATAFRMAACLVAVLLENTGSQHGARGGQAIGGACRGRGRRRNLDSIEHAAARRAAPDEKRLRQQRGRVNSRLQHRRRELCALPGTFERTKVRRVIRVRRLRHIRLAARWLLVIDDERQDPSARRRL